MLQVRYTATLAMLQVVFICLGVLVTQVSVAAFYGHNRAVATITEIAVGYWSYFLLVPVGWSAYALIAERVYGCTNRFWAAWLPFGIGVVATMAILVFYLVAIVVTMNGPLLSLAG